MPFGKLGIYSKPGAVLIAVDDTGSSVKPEDMALIFENGFSTKGKYNKNFEIVGKCSDGLNALDFLENNTVDLFYSLKMKNPLKKMREQRKLKVPKTLRFRHFLAP